MLFYNVSCSLPTCTLYTKAAHSMFLCTIIAACMLVVIASIDGQEGQTTTAQAAGNP